MLLEIVVIAIFITTFLIQPSRIASGSMYPTLNVGDFLLVDKQAYGPSDARNWILPREQVKRGDIVVFHFAQDPTLDVVKRVVGLPGDRVKMRDGRVLINGQAIDEPWDFFLPGHVNRYRDDFPYLHEPDPTVDPHWWNLLRKTVKDGELTVPPEQYFVLGDNRNDSDDSRYWGFVPRSAMIGRPLVVYFAPPPVEPDESVGRRLLNGFANGWRSFRVVR